MAIRNDNSIEVVIDNIEQFSNKKDIRDFVLKKWITEEPGNKYRYFVENLEDNNRIYLERPGRLNKGCDFVIYAENLYTWNNGNDRPPDHNFILEDIRNKKKLMKQDEWNNFINSIFEIYESNSYSTAIKYTGELPSVGYTYEVIFKLTRWFFIEQDITYWNGQGRTMFYNAIKTL